ncbi:hypothetical protein BC940DRAFT_345340 [Gongronella butleri]|nr:hypothetical protein BC940DRAFT_345340 [Gongronella butleri]
MPDHTCDKCQKSFFLKKTLLEHVRYSHGHLLLHNDAGDSWLFQRDTQGNPVCPFCNQYSFRFVANTSHHIKKMHMDNAKTIPHTRTLPEDLQIPITLQDSNGKCVNISVASNQLTQLQDMMATHSSTIKLVGKSVRENGISSPSLDKGVAKDPPLTGADQEDDRDAPTSPSNVINDDIEACDQKIRHQTPERPRKRHRDASPHPVKKSTPKEDTPPSTPRETVLDASLDAQSTPSASVTVVTSPAIAATTSKLKPTSARATFGTVSTSSAAGNRAILDKYQPFALPSSSASAPLSTVDNNTLHQRQAYVPSWKLDSTNTSRTSRTSRTTRTTRRNNVKP